MASKRPTETEMAIIHAIKAYLESVGCLAIRINAGAVPIENEHGRRFYRGAPAGTSDILGCMPNGRFLAIEAKRPGMKTTPKQEEFIQSVRAAGGVAGVAHSVEDAITLTGLHTQAN